MTNVHQGGYAQGGSTVTQQLARAIFLTPQKTISRKVNEALVAFEIERRYSKDQILTMYANEIYLGHGNYGVEAACRYYFGKSVKDVTLAEAALLAGIVQRPEDQSPFRNPAQATRAARHGAASDGRPRGYHRGRAQGGRRQPSPSTPLLAESIVGPYFCEEVRQYLEKPTARRTSTAGGCGSSRRSTPRCRHGRRSHSPGDCARSRAGTGSRSPATSRRRGIRSLESYVDPSWEGVRIQEGADPERGRDAVGPAAPR